MKRQTSQRSGLRTRRGVMFVLLICLLASGACRGTDSARRGFGWLNSAQEPPPLEFIEDEDEMLQRLLDYVPPGTSFVQAEKLMTAAGCECSFREDDGRQVLSCRYVKSMGLWVVKDWGIHIDIRDGRVYWMSVSFGYVGV